MSASYPKYFTIALSSILFSIALFQKGLGSVCFPENNKEECFSCSSEYFAENFLYTQNNQLLSRSRCILKNSNYTPVRNILVGSPTSHLECFLPSSSLNNSCEIFFLFLKNFDSFFENIFDAMISENQKAAKFSNSSATFYVFGEAAFFSNNSFENFQFFRRVFTKIVIKPLECSIESMFSEVCLLYSKREALILVENQRSSTIYVAYSLIIKDMKIRFYPRQANDNINFESYSTFISLEPIMDGIPFQNSGFTLSNSTLEAKSSDSNAVNFLRGSNVGEFMRFEFVVIKFWSSGDFLTFFVNKDPDYKNLRGTALVLSNVTFSDLNLKGILFNLEQLKGLIIFEDIELKQILNLNFLKISDCSQIMVFIKNMRVNIGAVNRLLHFAQAEVYINGLFLNNLSFSNVPSIEFIDCGKSDLKKLEIISSAQGDFYSGSAAISLINCSQFRIGNGVFLGINGFSIQISYSSVIIEGSSLLSIVFLDFVIKASYSNLTLIGCSFSQVEGKGVLLMQVKENLLIMSCTISKFKGIVVINFSELKNNVIVNCDISQINYPNFFWARNLQVEKQLILNTKFSDSHFKRLQSFYGKFSFHPLVVYKNSQFINMSFDNYISDYCCLDLLITNVTYQSIEMPPNSAFISVEIDGKYAFLDSKFIDVRWSSYYKSPGGGLNQAVFFLWYPTTFLVQSCSFILTKISSLRSGFVVSNNLNIPIFLINSSFIVQKPSKELAAKGILLMAIKRVEIINCTFINLTGDFHNLVYTHANGVISLLGSSSLLEKNSNNNSAYFENVTIINAESVNGAGIAVVSYNDLTLVNCVFRNGTAASGLGGMLAVVSVNNFLMNSTNIREGFAANGGLIYLKDVNNSLIVNCNFSQSESTESGGCIAILFSNVSIVRTIVIRSKTTGVGGLIYQEQGFLIINQVDLSDIAAKSDGGAFYLKDVDNMEISFSVFNSINTGDSGGLIYGDLHFLSIFKIDCSNFKNYGDGAIFILESFFEIKVFDSNYQLFSCENLCKQGYFVARTLNFNSNMMIKNVSINRAITNAGSAIYVYSDTRIVINGLKIQDWKGGHIFSFSGFSSLEAFLSKVSVKNASCLVTDMFYYKNCHINIADIQEYEGEFKSSVFHMIMSYVVFEDVLLKADLRMVHFNSMSSFYLVESSTLSFSGFLLDSYDKLSMMRIFLITESDIKLEGYKFKASTEIESIFAFNSNLTMINCEFFPRKNASINSSPSVVIFDSNLDNFLYLKGSIFILAYEYSLRIFKAKELIITNSSFSGELSEMPGKTTALLIESIESLQISRTLFQNLNGEQGAAIAFMPPLKKSIGKHHIKISDCSFINIKSKNGAAIYINGIFDLTLNDCLFERNYALSYSQHGTKNGVGGGGFFYCLNTRMSDTPTCQIALTSNTFINNKASFHSPSFFSNINVMIKNNTFQNEIIEGEDDFESFIAYPVQVSYQQNGNITERLNIKSGNSASFKVILSDSYGHLLNFDSTSFAKIQQSINNKPIIRMQNSFNFSKNGVIEFNEFKLWGPSEKGLNLSLILTHQSIQNEYKLPIFILKCDEGHIIQLDNTCRKCEKETFSFWDPQTINECKRCMPNFECRGGSEVYPLPGFWRQSKYDVQAVKCLISGSCLGGTKKEMTEDEKNHGACIKGHQGNLCFHCEKGFGKLKSQSLCKECKDQTSVLITRAIGVTVALLVVVLLNIYLYIKNKNKIEFAQESKQAYDFVFLKIIFGHLQTISIITFMEDFSSFQNFADILNIQSYLSILNDDFISFDCLFDQTSLNSTLIKTIGVISFPIILSCACLIIWMSIEYMFIKRTPENTIIQSQKKNSRFYKFLKMFLVSFSLAAYLLYPMILQSTFSLPNCIEFNDGSPFPRKFLYINPDIECWSDVHNYIILFVFIPSLILWGFIFPILLSSVFRYFRASFNKKTEREKKEDNCGPSIKNLIVNLEFKVFLFFYEDYKDKLYYWEIIIFFKKLVLTGLSGLRNLIGYELKLHLIGAAIIVYSTLVLKNKPFKSSKYNNYEFFSALVSVVFLMLLSITHNSGSFILVDYFALSINIIFIAFLFLEGVYRISKNKWSKRKLRLSNIGPNITKINVSFSNKYDQKNLSD